MSIPVSFIDESTPGPSGPITSWAWNFGDGGTSTAENPIHNFAVAGNHTVSLTVTGTGTDGTASSSEVVTVIDFGALNALFSESVSGLAVTFTDHSTPGPSGPITGWSWNFGDGNTSTSQNPVHTYASTGTYTATLTVTGTNPDGTDIATAPVAVNPSSVIFDGRAERLTTLNSHQVIPPATYTNGPITWPDGSVHYFYIAQSPKVWNGCLCFIKDDISLQADSRYSKVYKIAVTTGDTNPWHGSTGGTVNGAGQCSEPRNVALETWDWYAVAIRVDAWNLSPSDIRFCEILSIGYQTSSNTQVGFCLSAGAGGALQFSMNVNAGYANGVQGSASGTTHFDNDPVLPVTFSRWEEFAIGVKSSTHKTGAIEIHHRPVIAGVPGAWTQVYNKTNIDTELYGPIYDHSGNLIRNFAQDASNWPEVIDKMGLYFGHSSQTVTTETVYCSGPVICSDLATAQGTFPS